MKTLQSLLLVLLFSATLSTTYARKPPKWLKGDWYGVGYQLDGDTWDVHLQSDKDQFLIDYPSLGCSGQWSVIEKHCKYAIALESLEEGKGNCDEGVKVRITRVTDNELNLSFLYVLNGEEKMIAFSNIVKSGAETKAYERGYYKNVD